VQQAPVAQPAPRLSWEALDNRVERTGDFLHLLDNGQMHRRPGRQVAGATASGATRNDVTRTTRDRFAPASRLDGSARNAGNFKGMTAPPGEVTREMKRVLPAARSVVFGAFSAADELATWWGPEGFSARSLEFNPRVGDSYRIEMQPPEGDPFYLTGEFREVEPPDRLAYTFVWEDPDPDDVETLVELSFRDLGEATEVVFAQDPFKTEARRELHWNGWTDSFDKLEQFIAQA